MPIAAGRLPTGFSPNFDVDESALSSTLQQLRTSGQGQGEDAALPQRLVVYAKPRHVGLAQVNLLLISFERPRIEDDAEWAALIDAIAGEALNYHGRDWSLHCLANRASYLF